MPPEANSWFLFSRSPVLSIGFESLKIKNDCWEEAGCYAIDRQQYFAYHLGSYVYSICPVHPQINPITFVYNS